MRAIDRTIALWLAVGWVGFAILPWYVIEDGFWAFDWLFDGYPLDGDYAPAVLQVFVDGKAWLAPIALFRMAPLALAGRKRSDPFFSTLLIC